MSICLQYDETCFIYLQRALKTPRAGHPTIRKLSCALIISLNRVIIQLVLRRGCVLVRSILGRHHINLIQGYREYIWSKLFTCIVLILKHALQSSVISKQTVIKSKDDLIKLQNKDTGSEKRNKRIFGMILGTLQKFKTEDKLKSETTQVSSH